MRIFLLSHVVTILGLLIAYWWGGLPGLGITLLLVIMEVTLSFDNAVVNATVLRDMNERWQGYFLTWGMLIAVFGMRLLFPVVIVALATGLPAWDVVELAFRHPQQYSEHVLAAHVQIASFGGMFLLMVFLHFILDEHKTLHWLGRIEANLAAFGKLEAVEIIVALSLLLGIQTLLPEPEEQHMALVSGLVGVILYVTINSVMALFTGTTGAAGKAGYSGLMGFIYLQLLDASFSLDGVIGAFAISIDVVVIMLGLGIGAMFVRSLTVYMVRKGTLDRYVFLEHGAHYGVGALAAIMLISLMTPVSEVITGTVGVAFILLSLWSSVRHNRLSPPNGGAG